MALETPFTHYLVRRPDREEPRNAVVSIFVSDARQHHRTFMACRREGLFSLAMKYRELRVDLMASARAYRSVECVP